MRIYIFCLLLLCNLSCRADSHWIQQNYITGLLSSGYFPIRTFDPTEHFRPLPQKSLDPADAQIIQLVDEAFDTPNTNLGILLLDKERIVYERFKNGLDGSTKFFSYSMSKSLTAYTVGMALCSGQIKSIHDAAGKYSSEIASTVFGQSSIRNLLMMTSGARRPDQDGGSRTGEWGDITMGRKSIDDILQSYGRQQFDPGTFVYNNSNTNALMLALNGGGNFGNLFEKTIWLRSQPKNSATWLVDKKGAPYAAAGFGASLTDWGRLAIQSIRMRNGAEGPCVADFMKEATKEQTRDLAKPRYYGYGYQTWVHPRAESQIYLWLGAYGQRIIIDPIHEKVLILFRHSEHGKTTELISKLFWQWSQTK